MTWNARWTTASTLTRRVISAPYMIICVFGRPAHQRENDVFMQMLDAHMPMRMRGGSDPHSQHLHCSGHCLRHPSRMANGLLLHLWLSAGQLALGCKE